MKVELEVSKETMELCQGLAKVVQNVKQALADGWSPGQDLPVILTTVIADLVPALQGVEQIPAELQDKQHFANAIYAGLSPVVFGLLK